jgi:hypothetical protein
MVDGYILEGTELELVNELESVRAELKELKTRETALRAEILGILNGESRGLTAAGSQVVNIRIQHRRAVNSSKLEALYPEVYADVVEEKETTVLSLG